MSRSRSQSPVRTESHPIATRSEWLAARHELLAEEKALSRARSALAAKRRALPWVKVDKDYVFQSTDGKDAKLSSLFVTHNTVIVQHVMFDEGWDKVCSMCSYWLDGYESSLPHFRQRFTLVAVAKASAQKLADCVAQKGWTIPFYSSLGNTFNLDYGVEFTEQQQESKEKAYNFGSSSFWFCPQAPGISVFRKGIDGVIYHTYSTYGPGISDFQTMFQLLDITPEGRVEGGDAGNMSWVKHKEEY